MIKSVWKYRGQSILDLAADVTCGDVINPTTGAAYVAADADNCAVALQNQIAGVARSLVCLLYTSDAADEP